MLLVLAWVCSYVLHEAAVGGSRAAEVGNLEADVQVRCGVRDCEELVSSLNGRSHIQINLTWHGSVPSLDLQYVPGYCGCRD